jgi:hypothetical protein
LIDVRLLRVLDAIVGKHEIDRVGKRLRVTMFLLCDPSSL